ncbi:MAG: hypothetical protein UR27_C0022G0003 [Candidatus Peregrinibacteria bacterium GW2011_GWA2_33_10]|nr:MAG: hypothetical protein UR27_C0022G0003 [Candidatus Peregrinibacteria bacterium GW2011_GWA2_33_10]OGJ49304.1 MAG: hypothetical protein A2229_01745 [Candidatus Peregrinibacteria bacterium RIFOXYA2_FULL_33_7]
MSKRKSTGILPALLFIIIVLSFVFYVIPMKDQVKTLNQQIVEQEIEAEKVTAKLDELEAFYEQLPANSAIIAKQIPTDLKESQLILLMEEIASLNGISFSSLGFGPGGREPGAVSPVKISASFTGSYESLISFLQALEKTKERKFVVRSISVSLSDPESLNPDNSNPVDPKINDGTDGKYLEKPLYTSFSIDLEAYYQGVIK